MKDPYVILLKLYNRVVKQFLSTKNRYLQVLMAVIILIAFLALIVVFVIQNEIFLLGNI